MIVVFPDHTHLLFLSRFVTVFDWIYDYVSKEGPKIICKIGKFVNKLQFYEQALLTIPKILLNSSPFIDSLTRENV